MLWGGGVDVTQEAWREEMGIPTLNRRLADIGNPNGCDTYSMLE